MISESQTLAEVLAEVRKIEIRARGMVRDEFGGDYHSSFKGQGIDFHDLREYNHGDEIRAIDWNTTARTGAPYVKQFIEERELTVYLAVDISASSAYGSIRHARRRVAAQISAIFGFSAVQNTDKVGLILFSDQVEHYVPPRKGSSHILRLLREILFFKPKSPRSDPSAALNALLKRRNSHALVLLISDFMCADFAQRLRVTAKKHDIVAVRLSDPAEAELPAVGPAYLVDPETGVCERRNTSSKRERKRYQESRQKWRANLDECFRRAGVDSIELSTDPDANPGPALHAFFARRSGRSG